MQLYGSDGAKVNVFLLSLLSSSVELRNSERRTQNYGKIKFVEVKSSFLGSDLYIHTLCT